MLTDKKNLGCSIKKIAIKDPNKIRNAPSSLFTTNAELILSDQKINTIVELIDDAEAAFKIVSTAMKKGMHVISVNKDMNINESPCKNCAEIDKNMMEKMIVCEKGGMHSTPGKTMVSNDFQNIKEVG